MATYRAVVEIHDGLRQLRAYAVPAELKIAGNFDKPPDERDAGAVTVAAYVRNALWRHRLGRRVSGASPAPPPDPLLRFSGTDLDKEATWLARIAIVFERCVTPISSEVVIVDDEARAALPRIRRWSSGSR